MTELDRQIADYKAACDAGRHVSPSDAVWLLNELIYERDLATAKREQLAAANGRPALAVPLENEWAQLVADHSVALAFVREITEKKCAADCGTCIRCRARAWLLTEQPDPPAVPLASRRREVEEKAEDDARVDRR